MSASKKNHVAFLIISICLLFSLNSCENKEQKLKKHYTTAMFDRVWLLSGKDSIAKANQVVDSLFETLPKLSISDKCEYFLIKSDLNKFSYSKYNNLDASLAYADSIISLIEVQKLEKDLASEYSNAFNMKCNLFMQLKKYPEAFTAINQCKLIGKVNGDFCSLGQYTGTQALINYRQGKFKEAANDFKEAITLAKYCKMDETQFYRMQGLLDNLGLTFFEMKQNDSALKYYELAKNYITENRKLYVSDLKFPDIALAVVYGNISAVYVSKSDYKTAVEYLDRSIAINSQEGFDNDDALISLINKADLFVKMKNANAAQEILNGTKTKLSSKNNNAKLVWFRTNRAYAKLISNKEMELNSLRNFYALKDSVAKTEAYILNTDPQLEFEKLEKKYELDLLKKNNEIQQIYIIAAILIVLFLLSLSFIIYRNLLKTRRMVFAKQQLNNALKNREEELSKLLVEREKIKDKERLDELYLQEIRLQMDYNDAINVQRLDISNDLHDGLSGSLAALKYYVDDLKVKSTTEDSKEVLSIVGEEVASIYENARGYMHDLRKNNWDTQFNLIGFLHELSQKFSKNNFLKIELDIDEFNIRKRFTNLQLKLVNHIIREVISNTLKHAQATQLTVAIQFDKQNCVLKAEDNGVGFDHLIKKDGIGITRLKSITDELKGQITINGKINSGTSIIAEFPCADF